MNNPIAGLRRHRAESDMADLIGRHLRGELDSAEALAIENRLENDEEFRAYVEPLIALVTAGQRLATAQSMDVNKDAAWQRFRERAIAEDPTAGATLPEKLCDEPPPPSAGGDKSAIFTDPPRPTIRERLREIWHWRIRPQLGKSFGVLVGIWFASFLWFHVKDVAMSNPSAVPATAATTPLGMIGSAPLSFGSKVTLAPGSTITTPESADGQPMRSIGFDGEGFFEVAETIGAPYAVTLTDRKVTLSVPPTAEKVTFDIHSYRDEDNARVVVMAGTVQVVQGSAAPVVVKANQEVTISDAGITAPRVTRDSLSWRNGMHRYRGALLRDVLMDLRHWYGTKYTFQFDYHFDATVSASFPVGTRLDSIAQVLTMGAGFEIHRARDENKLVVH